MWFSRYTQALDCLLKVKKVRQHIDKHHKTQISNKTVRAFDPNVCGSTVWIFSRHVTWPTMCTHSWIVLVSKNFLKLRDGDYLVPLRIHFQEHVFEKSFEPAANEIPPNDSQNAILESYTNQWTHGECIFARKCERNNLVMEIISWNIWWYSKRSHACFMYVHLWHAS